MGLKMEEEGCEMKLCYKNKKVPIKTTQMYISQNNDKHFLSEFYYFVFFFCDVFVI